MDPESFGGQTTRLDGWLSRLKNGDEVAINEILQFFDNRITTMAHSMLRGFPQVRQREETADVVQNASLRLIRALKDVVSNSMVNGASFGTRDLLRLAATQIRRELLDLAKHYRRQREPRIAVASTDRSEDAPRQEYADNGTWNPHRIAEWADFHEQAAMLAESEREVFELLWYHGLTQAEAAVLLGVDVRTIKNRWQRARIALHAALGGRMPGAD